jgi:hypothetical protein
VLIIVIAIDSLFFFIVVSALFASLPPIIFDEALLSRNALSSAKAQKSQ